jgi:hypothetical protein
MNNYNKLINNLETLGLPKFTENIEKYINASIIANKPLRLYIHNGDYKNDMDEDHVQMNFKDESIDKLKEIKLSTNN